MLHQLPAFRTLRLTLRPRTIDDLKACMAMDHDPEVTRFLPSLWTDPVAHRAFVEAHAPRVPYRHGLLVRYGGRRSSLAGFCLPLWICTRRRSRSVGDSSEQLGVAALRRKLRGRSSIMRWARSGDSRYRSGEHGVGKPRRKPGFRLAGSVGYNGHAFPRYVACASAGQK